MTFSPSNLSILVTGGAGFIGCNFIRYLLDRIPDAHVVNLDALTYAGSLKNLADIMDDPRHRFVEGSICDGQLALDIIRDHDIDVIVNFAAESHVDRSINGPADFIQTNIVGAFSLLEAAREAWRGSFDERRFVHVSTDEVYGSLTPDDPPFSEITPYAPNSPYAASKAAADHLVRAYHRTYGLPTLTTNCSNNYGPYQYPEKLIPLMILNALDDKPLPVYGDGLQVRDWLYVEDHCAAVLKALTDGCPGETYNIGGGEEKRNIDIVQMICEELDRLHPRLDGNSYADRITHVKDRPGHDRRYAINAAKIELELGWAPEQSFESGLKKTIQWYIANRDWAKDVMSEKYADWIDINYNRRDEVF